MSEQISLRSTYTYNTNPYNCQQETNSQSSTQLYTEEKFSTISAIEFRKVVERANAILKDPEATYNNLGREALSKARRAIILGILTEEYLSDTDAIKAMIQHRQIIASAKGK